METAIGLFFFGLCGFLMLKALAASFKMSKARGKIYDDISKRKKYYYYFELAWPFSLFRSKSEHLKEHRYHLIDMIFYLVLFFLAMMAFALVTSFFE